MLEGIYRVLTVYSVKREECALGLTGTEYGRLLEKLMSHKDGRIYKKASDILDVLHQINESTNESNMRDINMS